MPTLNTTYEEYLEMFGTQEQKDEWEKQRQFWDAWIKDNIPVYNPDNRLFRGGDKYNPENDTLYID